MIQKVTLFITCPGRAGPQLLLIRHPYAGIQLPAGTVEADETPTRAARREAFEETGLQDFSGVQYLTSRAEPPAAATAIVCTATSVYARPDTIGFHWTRLPRGITVACLRQKSGFTQIDYQETDALDNPRQISYRITGWVPDSALTTERTRSFFLLHAEEGKNAHPTVTQWEITADGHRWKLFWADLADLPPLVSPQDTWLDILWQAQRS